MNGINADMVQSLSTSTTPTTPSTPARAERLRPVARQWVSQTFFGTMLKQARESPLVDKDSPFSGGRGGEAFTSLLDQHLATTSAEGVGGDLVEAIVDRLTPGEGPETDQARPKIEVRA